MEYKAEVPCDSSSPIPELDLSVQVVRNKDLRLGGNIREVRHLF